MEKPDVLPGVRFGAILLVLGGSLVGMSALGGFTVVALLGFKSHAKPGWHSAMLMFSLYLFVLGAFSFACFRVASGLYQLSKRARYNLPHVYRRFNKLPSCMSPV